MKSSKAKVELGGIIIGCISEMSMPLTIAEGHISATSLMTLVSKLERRTRDDVYIHNPYTGTGAKI